MTTMIHQHAHTIEFLRTFDSHPKIANAIILDSGCGDGFASQQFVRWGAKHVDAHDPFARLPASTDKITYHKNYIELSETYDIIWSHHVIEHVECPIQYLRVLKLQLKKDGELWLGCPNMANVAAWSNGHINNFDIGNLTQCLQRAGFGVSSIRWLLNPGQLRIRVPADGSTRLPTRMQYLYEKNIHFSLNQLTPNYRWCS